MEQFDSSVEESSKVLLLLTYLQHQRRWLGVLACCRRNHGYYEYRRNSRWLHRTVCCRRLHRSKRTTITFCLCS